MTPTRPRSTTTIALDWKAIHRLADSKIATVRRIIVRALDAARDSVTDEEIAAAWLHSPEGMRRAVDWTTIATILGAPTSTYVVYKAQTAADVYGSLFADGGRIAGGALGGRLDLTVSQAIEYGQRRAGTLITAIQSQQLGIVREHLGSALRDGIEPARLGRMLRSTTGLSPRQARALENYERGLYEKFRTGSTSIPLRGAGRPLADQRYSVSRLDEQKIQTLVDRYRERLVNYRAEMIARTETMRSANAGAYAEWMAAGRSGLLDLTTARRIWIVTPDDRTCDDCMMLSGQTVGMTEAFTLQGYAVDGTPLDPVTSEMPPIHPSCRCTTVLEVTQESMNNAFESGVDPFGAPSFSLDDVLPPERDPFGTGSGLGFSSPIETAGTAESIGAVESVGTASAEAESTVPEIASETRLGARPSEVVEYGDAKADAWARPFFEKVDEIHGMPQGERPGLTTIDPKAKMGTRAEAVFRTDQYRSPTTGEIVTKPNRISGSVRWTDPARYERWLERVDDWNAAAKQGLVNRPLIAFGRARVSEADYDILAHEFGHRIDYFVPNGARSTSGEFLSEFATRLARNAADGLPAYENAIGHPEVIAEARRCGEAFLDFFRVARDESVWSDILDAAKAHRMDLDWMRNPSEIWARAYAQYLAEELRALGYEATYNAWAAREATMPVHWPEEYFREHLKPAIDAVLRARGML